jgi:hypothetical protein
MITTAFAEIVGLLCHYRQEKGDREALDHQKFIEWLEYHRHEEIKNLIVNTAALRTEIDGLLRSDHTLMLQKLDQIQDMLIKLLGRTEEFKGLALAMAPDTQLSDQAVLVLRQLVESAHKKFVYSDYGGDQWCLQFIDGEQEPMEALNPRFIEDDLNQLANLQLLTVEYNADGTGLYGITRSAVKFVEAISGKTTSNSTSESA